MSQASTQEDTGVPFIVSRALHFFSHSQCEAKTFCDGCHAWGNGKRSL